MTQTSLEAVAKIARHTAYNAWRGTLIGTDASYVHALNARMRGYKVGDLVIETTTVYGMRHAPASELDAIGYLEEKTRERVDFGDPEAWNEAEDGPWPTQEIHYIRTLDGRRFRWENASFIAVLDDVSKGNSR